VFLASSGRVLGTFFSATKREQRQAKLLPNSGPDGHFGGAKAPKWSKMGAKSGAKATKNQSEIEAVFGRRKTGFFGSTILTFLRLFGSILATKTEQKGNQKAIKKTMRF